MSTAGDKIKDKIKQQGKTVNVKNTVNESVLKETNIKALTLQMLKDFGYIIEGS